MSVVVTGKRIAMGVPMRGRGAVGRLVMRRGGRNRGAVAGGRGGALFRGGARGGITRGHMNWQDL